MAYHVHPTSTPHPVPSCPTPTSCFRTEFATEGNWYANALRFTDPAEAVTEAAGRFGRWTVPVAWRVVSDTHPEKEAYDGTGHRTVDGVEV